MVDREVLLKKIKEEPFTRDELRTLLGRVDNGVHKPMSTRALQRLISNERKETINPINKLVQAGSSRPYAYTLNADSLVNKVITTGTWTILMAERNRGAIEVESVHESIIEQQSHQQSSGSAPKGSNSSHQEQYNFETPHNESSRNEEEGGAELVGLSLFNTLKEENRDLVVKVGDLSRENGVLVTEKKHLEERCQDLSMNIEKKAEELRQLTQQEAHAQQQVRDGEQRLTKDKYSFRFIGGTLVIALLTVGVLFYDAVSDLQTERSDLLSQKNNLQSETKALRAGRDADREHYKNKIQQSSGQIKSLLNSSENLSSDLKDLQKRHSANELELQRKSLEIEALRKQLDTQTEGGGAQPGAAAENIEPSLSPETSQDAPEKPSKRTRIF